MDTWSLPKARPISCNDCPAFQRDHMSLRWFAESFTRLACVINTTFREKIYSRWCCNDRLSWHLLSECRLRSSRCPIPGSASDITLGSFSRLSDYRDVLR